MSVMRSLACVVSFSCTKVTPSESLYLMVTGRLFSAAVMSLSKRITLLGMPHCELASGRAFSASSAKRTLHEPLMKLMAMSSAPGLPHTPSSSPTNWRYCSWVTQGAPSLASI